MKSSKKSPKNDVYNFGVPMLNQCIFNTFAKFQNFLSSKLSIKGQSIEKSDT